MKTFTCTAALVLLALAGTLPAAAQKGTGQAVGVARQGLRPALVTLSGTLLAARTGPCEKTTGRALEGTHLLLRTAAGDTLNLHLGPAGEVAEVVGQLTPGQSVTAEAFRTDALPAGAYIARVLHVGGRRVVLRDDTLRPAWAAGAGRGAGRRGAACCRGRW